MAQGSLILPGVGKEGSGTSGQTACGAEKPQGIGRSQTKGQYRNMGILEGDGPRAGGCQQLCDALRGLIHSLCNDVTRKLQERSPAKPGLTPHIAAPGAFSELAAYCWRAPSPYTGSRGHGGLWPCTPHPSKEKQPASLQALHKTLDLTIAQSFPGLIPTNRHTSHRIYTLGWHSRDGSCWKWVGGSGAGSRLGPLLPHFPPWIKKYRPVFPP